jgi:hypothetical protein
LEGRRVIIEGFMIATDFDKDKVTEFILARDPVGCCYSTTPQVHQFIRVRVKPPGVNEMTYNTVVARGVLHVGAKRDNGLLSSIYQMDAEIVKDSGK